MTEIIRYKDKNITEEKFSDFAYKIRSGIKEKKREFEKSAIDLGQMFKIIHDHELYTYLGAETFEEFIADPEIGFSRSTVYSFMRIYSVYVEQLQIAIPLLSQIGHANLQVILPVVKQEPETWIHKADQLSRSDLINEVREYQGKQLMEPKRKEPEVKPVHSYMEYVENCPCIVCGGTAEKAHFPITWGAGAPDGWVIPLCRTCHSEYHTIGVLSWFKKYRRHVAEYWYEKIIPQIWEE